MFIVDIQGFQYKDSDLICKEIAVININSGERHHHIVNFPYKKEWLEGSFRQHVEWTSNNLTGLDWDQFSFRNLPLEGITSFLQGVVENEQVFVKGHQKKIWLNNLISNDIKDLSQLGCKSLGNLNARSCVIHCNNHFSHNNRVQCALQNVLVLRDWYINKFNVLESVDLGW